MVASPAPGLVRGQGRVAGGEEEKEEEDWAVGSGGGGEFAPLIWQDGAGEAAAEAGAVEAAAGDRWSTSTDPSRLEGLVVGW